VNGAGVSAAESPESGAVPAWEFTALTDAGRIRPNNEDSVAFDSGLGLAVLADGMGGYNGGEVASGMAVAMMHASFGRWLSHAGAHAPPRAIRRALQAGIDESNAAILEAGGANPQLRGMGTTIVLATFGARRAVVGHIGDSRCYRLRGRELELLTRDHSLLQEQLDIGALTPEQALTWPHRNLVTRALGIERRVEIELHEHDVCPGDLFMLCSDGLNEMVPDAELFTLLLQDIGLPEKTRRLIAAANDNGGRDNISVVLARAGG
jgi:protein phosphatase